MNSRSPVLVPALAAWPSRPPPPRPPRPRSPPPADHRYEVTLLFGASLLSADGDAAERVFPIDSLRTLGGPAPAGHAAPAAALLRSRPHDHIGGSFLTGLPDRTPPGAPRVDGDRIPDRARPHAPPHGLVPMPGRGLRAGRPLQPGGRAGDRGARHRLSLRARVRLRARPRRGATVPVRRAPAPSPTTCPAAGATSFAFEFGAGARLSFSDRLGARLEVADRVVPDHFLTGTTEHDLHVRAGVVFRLP